MFNFQSDGNDNKYTNSPLASKVMAEFCIKALGVMANLSFNLDLFM